jgi:hypothetical protein
MTRAPAGGNVARGRTNVSPNRWLKRWARSRVSSTCWRLVGVVEEDVRGHQHRVVEEADAHRLLARALVLELGHAPQLAEGGDVVEQPGEHAVLGDVALHEERAPARIEPGRHQERGDLPGAGGELGRVPRHRERMEVDDAEQGVVAVLILDPAPYRPDVVPEVHVTGGLDS